jgi:hypothetical protein
MSTVSTNEIEFPLYRAQKRDNDDYVYGYYTERVLHYPSGRHYIHFHNGTTATYEKIDATSLAIHFPDMIDSNRNKIFAALSEDGRGGDILIEPMFEKKQIICKISASGYVNKHIQASYNNYEIMGIKQ